MKYLKWILTKGDKPTAAVWIISVVFGSFCWLALVIIWIGEMWNYFTYHIQPTMIDAIIVAAISLYGMIPAWIGYATSDRKLFYFGYMQDPDRN